MNRVIRRSLRGVNQSFNLRGSGVDWLTFDSFDTKSTTSAAAADAGPAAAETPAGC